MFVGDNPQFSYPVFLEGNECTPVLLSQCINGAANTKNYPCCVALSHNATPWAIIPTRTLIILILVVPIAIFLIRHLLLRERGRSREVFMGYAFSGAFTFTTTNIFKLFIAMPRPNHFALLLVAKILNSDHMALDARKSFPSGHSSLSMATMLYTTLVLAHDIKTRGDRWPLSYQARLLFLTLTCLPTLLALYIAATRVLNYWHATADILSGLCLGALWAVTAHSQVRLSHEIPATIPIDRPKHV